MTALRTVATLGCCAAVIFSESVRLWIGKFFFALGQLVAERRSEPIIDALTVAVGG